MKKHRILIVDDIPENIKVLQAILSNPSYEIQYAMNGKDALMLCVADSFDLILLDIMMPEMDGYEVCKYLKSKDKTKDIPVIFLTAKIDSDDIVKGFETGAQDYVTKPFNPQELIARVNTHLELKHKNESLKFMNLQLEERVAARTMELQDANNGLKEANLQLSKLEDAKNDFLSLMSTELREPLNGIVGFADMLEFSIKNKTNLKYVRFIKQACEKLIGVSDIALLLSALRFDRYEMKVVGLPVHEVVKSSTDKLRGLITERKVKLKIDIPKNYIVRGDERLLEICMEKILENAITNTPPRSEVYVGAELMGQKIKVFVKDTGTHFAEGEVNYTFRFFDLEKTERTEEFKRFTPGLVVVKLVMDLHKAKVDVENLQEGGVSVSFLLPEY
ncbi:hybrid sensor histidine kinase/response regulator [Marinifilum caeruleilacunae]|uniref:histidine kinase n=1 Tax=Marinifilum caeruleilacunae TaxID=2499076 RepID=A0ABX1WTI6_9BACT|nr:hybrid sensor histidine kinase/response regulator [Marinifilum caeruleilacunae]NOU59239.1 hybrid sensor histidine kinase/response regulator [Marinifilum caeruleilacunae]